MEKSLLVAQPFQLIARTKREACQWSAAEAESERRELADKNAAFYPRRKVSFAPLSRRAKAVYSVPERNRGANVKASFCYVQVRVKQVKPWTYPGMVLVPLCTAMVMAWPPRELRFSLAAFHYHSLPPAFWKREANRSW